MIDRAVILAGGAGTRLAATEPARPKPLVEVGGRPMLAHHFDLLVRHGVRDVLITLGHGAERVLAFLREGVPPGLRVRAVVEDAPLGTAGGLDKVRDWFTDDAFLLYGDVLVNMDLCRLAAFHRRSDAVATLVAHPNSHPCDSDLIDAAPGGRVRGLLPAKGRADGDYANLTSAALYALSPGVLEGVVPDRKQDFVRDVFPRLLAAGLPLAAYRTCEYLRDMGTPERLARVRDDAASGIVARGHRDTRRPAVFFDRDGVLNEEVGGVTLPDELRLLDGAVDAVLEVNRRGWLAILVTNQPLLAKGRLSPAGLDAVHRRLETLLGRGGAFLDAIYVCPHHPDRGFPGEVPELKRPCTCRKPAPGMLLRAAHELPVDLGRSFLVGDSWRDIAAALAARVLPIGVRSGAGCRTADPALRPSMLVDDVRQAVREAMAVADGFARVEVAP